MNFSDLKPGDLVLRHRSNWSGETRVVTVDRLTKTQIIIGERRFRIRDGEEVGTRYSWDSCWITIPTPNELREVLKRQKLDQKRHKVLALTEEVCKLCRTHPNAIDAIPHLEAVAEHLEEVLAVLKPSA